MTAIPVVGEPVAHGIGFLVLLLVAWPTTEEWVGSLVTVAHEGGHMTVGLLTGHRVKHFSTDDGDNAATGFDGRRRGPGRIVTTFAGYVTAPIAGGSWSSRSSASGWAVGGCRASDPPRPVEL